MIKSIVRILNDGVEATIGFAVLPFYTLVYLVDLTLFIPIRTIVEAVSTFESLSDVVGSAYDTEVKEVSFAMIFYSEDAGVKPLLGTSSIAGALFGAIHCLAWNFSFPSRVEQVMWITVSLGVVGSCAVTLLYVLCFGPWIGHLFQVNRVLFYLSITPFAMASIVYPVARITLLVLAITSLRSLPPSALDTIDWVEFAPHI